MFRVASLHESSCVVDHLSVHRDVALAMMVRTSDGTADVDRNFLVAARCDDGTWHHVDDIADRDSVDCQFGGGAAWMAGRELTYRIDDSVILTTTVSPRGNWSFVYSAPNGMPVRGKSVVDGDFQPHDSD